MVRKPGTSGRAGLTRTAVVAAAAAIADDRGMEAVTLANLADDLGVRTPSLYNHIAGLTDLRQELALFALRDLAARIQEATAETPEAEGLFAFARAYRAYAREHPGLYSAIARGAGPADDPVLAAASEDLVELALGMLPENLGNKDDRLHAVRGLRSLVHGFVSIEAIGGFGLDLDTDQSFARAIQTFAAGLRATHRTTSKSTAPQPDP
jgi:AcrR family transcriptional regulator